MSTSADRPEPNCQIVRTLDVVGEKWSLLIVRNAMQGQSRFSEFRDDLGIPSDVLTARLGTLVAGGVLEKRSYREPGSRERFSYHLSARGHGLKVVIAAFMQWNDEFSPAPRGRVSVMADAETGEPLQLGYVRADGEVCSDDRVAFAPGPAATRAWLPFT